MYGLESGINVNGINNLEYFTIIINQLQFLNMIKNVILQNYKKCKI